MVPRRWEEPSGPTYWALMVGWMFINVMIYLVTWMSAVTQVETLRIGMIVLWALWTVVTVLAHIQWASPFLRRRKEKPVWRSTIPPPPPSVYLIRPGDDLDDLW